MIEDIIPFYNSSEKFIVKSKDCCLYDSEGKVYTDFEAGVWCGNIGHSNDRITKLITEQSRELIHQGYRFRNEYAESLSVELQKLMGLDNGASVFLSSGSEAVNLSISMARYLTGRKKILKVSNSYLSAYGFGRIADDNNDLLSVGFNDIESVGNIDFMEVAAFVIETGGASVEMVRFPENQFICNLVENCVKNNCLIVAEEVTTGMGRLGKWFGFNYYNFIPDIVVTGKALGNGFPISAVTISSKVKDDFVRNPFGYAQSHQNDPLGCAIGLEVIRIIQEENLIEQSRLMGEYFKDKLFLLKDLYQDKIKDIRGRGLMLALEFSEDFNGERLNHLLFESGFVAGFKLNTLRFLPPLIIQNADIDKLVDKLSELLRIKN